MVRADPGAGGGNTDTEPGPDITEKAVDEENEKMPLGRLAVYCRLRGKGKASYSRSSGIRFRQSLDPQGNMNDLK